MLQFVFAISGRWWRRTWESVQWWRSRSTVSLSLAGYISSAATGRASAVVPSWLYLAPTLCPETVVPREQRDFTVSTGQPCRERGGSCWGRFQPEVYNNLHCSDSIGLQVVIFAPGHQIENLTPAGRVMPAWDEPDEGGVICKLQEFDEPVVQQENHSWWTDEESLTRLRMSSLVPFCCSSFPSGEQ